MSRSFRPTHRLSPAILAILACLALRMFAGGVVYAQSEAQPSQPATTAVEPALESAPEPAAAAAPTTLPESWIEQMKWRSIGPANMGGRIIDLCIIESDPTKFWAATASGGLIRTINGGTTFDHQFDRESTVSIGDAAVAPSDPKIMWVGTGENNPRNSVSWGDGVYKSTDGGATWKNMGLRESFQIGRIIIHPTNPDIVFVGALGRLWGTSDERGLYKTTDGGETWDRIFYIDDKTGIIDIVMHPTDPETMLVAAWERQRDEFCTNDPAKRWGPGSGLFKTTDGGKTFRKITQGLPTCDLGRIGLDYYRANPDIVFATVDSVRIGSTNPNAAFMGMSGENAEVGARLTRITEDGPSAAAGLKTGDIVVAVDGKAILSYDDLTNALRERSAGDVIKVTASRERQPVEVEVTLAKRTDQAEFPFRDRLGGQIADIHDQQGPEGDEFGGTYRSDDGGETWKRINSLNPRPMYFSKIRVDPKDDQRIYILGVQLHISDDGGKTFRSNGAPGVHADHHAMWINPENTDHIILGNDGGLYITFDRGLSWDHLNNTALGQFYHVGVDSRKGLYYAYGGLQDNGSWGGPTRSRSGSGLVNADWFRVGGGDGFITLVCPDDPNLVYYESQNGSTGWRNLLTGRGGSLRPPTEEGQTFRWNWKTPFILSANNSRIYFNAGSHVFRTLAAGTGMKRISPEITRTERGSATALSQSPLDTDVLYVGTDDGAVWMTRDGGHDWVDLFNLSAAEERPAQSEPAPGGRLMDSLRRMDANEDGKIQRDEVPERMRRMFDRFDTNSDGVIDEEEMTAAAARGPGRPPQPAPVEPAAQTEPAPPVTTDEGSNGNGNGHAEGNGEQPAAAPPAETSESPAASGESEAKDETTAPGAAAETTDTQDQATEQPAAPSTDTISGEWDARITAEVPPGTERFRLIIRLEEDGAIAGETRSEAVNGTIRSGTFIAESGELKLIIDSPLGEGQITGTLSGDTLRGTITAQGGALSIPFMATRAAPATAEAAATPIEPAAPATPAAAEMQAGEEPRTGRRSRRRDPAPEAPSGKPLIDLIDVPMHIAAIEASRFVAGRVYIAFDGHRSNNDAPHIFVSEDFGRTWRSIVGNLPGTGSVRTIREDISRPDVLYVGTEFACFVTINRGEEWTRLNGNLPTVAVHEFAQHPTNGEIIAGTHGRSLWIMDATTLRQVTPDIVKAPAHLFRPNTAHIWRSEPARGISGARNFRAEDPPSGAQIYYSLGAAAPDAKLAITHLDGTHLRSLEIPSTDPGLHRIAWDLRADPPAEEDGRGRRRFAPRMAPGEYRVVLTVDGKDFTQPLRIEWDPDYAEHQMAEYEEATDDHHRQELLEDRREDEARLQLR